MSLTSFINRGLAFVIVCIFCGTGYAASPQPAGEPMKKAKDAQSITLTALEARTYGDADFSPGATASSGLPASYTSSNPNVATIVENQVHIVGVGSTTIIAKQPGDNTYLTAKPVRQVLSVRKAAARVILGDLEQTYDRKPKPITATTVPAGLKVRITYDRSSRTPLNAGSYAVAAMVQDANYEGSATGTLTISRAPQTLAFESLNPKAYGDKPFRLLSTTTSGLAPVYESSDPRIATISKDRVKIMGAGTVWITAFQAGDSNNLPAEPVRQTLLVKKAPARVSLSNLDQTYDSKPRSANAATKPTGLAVKFTYNGSEAVPVDAGMYAVAAMIQDANYEESAAGTLAIGKAPQTISFASLEPRTYGNEPFRLSSTTTGGLNPAYESSDPRIATISGSEVKIINAGTTVITAFQAGDHNNLPAEPVRQTLIVKKASAGVFLSNLDHTYDGRPGSAVASTEPVGLAVRITYDGSTEAPANAGQYTVSATVQDINHEGSASATMTIAKSPQKISFDPLKAKTYGNGDFPLKATASSGHILSGASSDVSVAVIDNGRVHIAGAGSTTITVSQPGDGNFLPAEQVQQVLIVKKAPAKVSLRNIDQIFDNTPRAVDAITEPAGLAVGFTYNNSATAPIAVGRYQVKAAIQDANYEGSIEGRMTIAKALQRITLNASDVRTYGDADFSPEAAASSGLPVSYTSTNPKVAVIVNNQVHITGAGSSTIIAAQAGDTNYREAEQIKQTLMVKKARAALTLTDLEQTYDNRAKPAAATTEPKGLSVILTYNTTASAPTNAGSYAVVGTVRDANYEGSATGTLTIAKAPQSITFDALAKRTYGDGPFALISTVTSGLTATYESSNPAVAAVSNIKVRVAGAGIVEITAYQAGDINYLAAEPMKQTLVVNKARAKIILTGLEQQYDGAEKQAVAGTEPQGLTVHFTYDNKTTAPASAGTYTVAGVVQDDNYEGSAAAKLTIAKAPQSMTFTTPAARAYGDADFSPGSATSSGLPATYTSSNLNVASIVENKVHVVGIGSSTIIAAQPGDTNYLAAEPVKQVLLVNKARAKVILTGLEQTYDGAEKQAKARTEPQGLTVTLAYDNMTAAPVKVGTYTVAGIVRDDNYEGSAIGTMTIAKARQSIMFTVPETVIYDARPFSLIAAPSSGLPAAYVSSNTSVATINGDEVRTVGTGTATITALQAGDGNYQPAEPVQQMLVVRGIPRHIAVLPLVNMSGQPAPLKEIRQAMIERLVAQGAVVLDDKELEGFMARHRMRNVDGIDTETAQALQQETGMEAVLITALEQYVDTRPPAISMTSRLVFASGTPIILWMETVQMSGDDSPGVLGLGLINDMTRLQKKALDRLTGPFAKYLAGETNWGNGKGEPRFQPKTFFSSSFMRPGRRYTIAVAPFWNMSGRHNADAYLLLHFLSRLTKEGSFIVIDPGAVREKLLSFRFILQGGLSMRQADIIHDQLQADLILTGKVIEYQDAAGMPKVEFNTLVFERKRKKVVWTSWSYNQGDDGVFFFDRGQISMAAALASKMTQAVVQDMTAQGMIKKGKLPEEQSSKQGPWNLDRHDSKAR
jgi:TolB-like protein